MIYLITFLVVLFLVFIIRLFAIKNSLIKLENNIKKAFNSRTNTIPAIFEVTKNSFSKHNDIFKEILKHRKEELYNYHYIESNYENNENDFAKLIHIEELIHHELNFIFKVANKHPKLSKKGNFIYLREIIIDKSYNISNLISEYKRKVKIFNYLINLKKFTIIGILIPISKKNTI